MSLEVSTQKLIGGGSPFELINISNGQREIKVYRHAPATLPELYRRALKKSERELIVFGQTRLTFKQSYVAAERVAAVLGLNYAVRVGTRVAVLIDGTPEWLQVFLGLTLLGAVPVLIGRRDARQVEHCIVVARCELVIADGAQAVPSRDDSSPRWMDVRELIVAAERQQLQLPALQTPIASDEAIVLFTSGSTGLPKAVSASHLSVISGLMNMMLGSALATLEERDRTPVTTKLPPCALIHTPLNYIGGLSAVLMAIMNGTRIVVTDGWNIDAVAALVDDEKVTALPHLSRSQLEALLSRENAIHRLASIGLHGAGVPRKWIKHIAASVPALKVVSGYGLTETGGSIAVISGSTLIDRPGSSGRIVPTVDVRIDRSNAGSAALEESGELLVSGACLMRGYLQEGRASEVDWFNTGDVAHIAEDGHVYIDYRSSESSVIGRSHFNSAAVERNLENLDGIAEVSVLSSREREQLCVDVAVAILPGRKVERALIEQAMAPLVEAAGPIRIHFCESLPRTPSGKVNRVALAALLLI